MRFSGLGETIQSLMCVGVVCELDSVFLFVFVFLSFVGVFWLGLPCFGVFSGIFLLVSLILAQDERWRRA